MNLNNFNDSHLLEPLSTVTRFTEGLLENNFDDLLRTSNPFDYFPR
jgi:hypothetical protein